MKKVLLVILILLIILFSCIYIFIPGQIRISAIALAPCIAKNVTGCLANNALVDQWWPEHEAKKNDTSFPYKKYDYSISEVFTDGAEIQLSRDRKNLNSKLTIIPYGKDSCAANWQTSYTSSLNPFKRLNEYLNAGNIKDDMQDLLNSLLNFAGNIKNVYGFPIERTTFTDTILFATRFSSTFYPSVETIYDHINQIKKRIKDAGATEKDFPMLNVNQLDSNKYEAMIAICINKEIPGDQSFFVSRMVPMKDRFLRTEVTGGEQNIQKAHKAIRDYMNDRFLSAPAIPFEILVTDRSKETDTSKWKTVIFHPSM
jgi:hypothetical protein